MSTPKGSNAAHTALVNELEIELSRLPYVRTWKQVRGLFYQIRWDSNGKVVSTQPVQTGIDGMADLGGILTRWDGLGLVLQVEAKTGGGIQNKDQIAWENMTRTRGGIYILARSVQETLDQVEREHLRGKP